MLPNSEKLLGEAYPAIITAIVEMPLTAAMYSIATFRSASHDPAPNGMTAEHQDRRGQHDDGREGEHDAVGPHRDDVLFRDEFDRIRYRLEQPERPHAVRPQPSLESAEQPALHPRVHRSDGEDAVRDKQNDGHPCCCVRHPRPFLAEQVLHEPVDVPVDGVPCERFPHQRSTSPMLKSRLPSVTIASASFHPTSISLNSVRLMKEGERTWQRYGAIEPSLTR